MREPVWLTRPILDFIHTSVIRGHGGTLGVRDEGLIESALQRPRNRWTYERQTDLAELAASYAHGLVKNHGFLDGNKRVAFMAAYTFLGLNDHDLEAPEPEVVLVTIDLASSQLTESAFAAWVRDRMVAVEE